MPQSEKQKIDGIELLRILASLGIALYHVGCYGNRLSLSLGVHLFFCISAFLCMLTTEKPKKLFLLKRLLRILPLYWLLTFATFAAAHLIPGLFGGEPATFGELIKSLLLIPYSREGMRTASVVRPIVGPGWTMYYDVCFAILFAVAMKLRHKWRGAITAGLCCLLLLGALLPDTNPFVHVYTKGYFLDFIAGIAVYFLWKARKGTDRPVRNSLLLRLGAALAALGGLGFLYTQEQHYLPDAAACFLILFATLLCFDGVRLPKAVPFLGKLSYSFYLLHYFVILVLGKVFDFSRLGLSAIVGTAAVILLSYLAAWVSYELIEKRFTGWIIAKLDRPKATE